MAEGLLTMFGKAYNTVGSADSNLVLLTRGDIKIRWGNKFIDLIKNGKINVETDTLKTIGSKDQIYKDGIYLVNNDGTYEVWAQIDGTVINLTGEVGTTYVSYIKEQNVNREGKFIALSNIGIYYNTYEEAVADGVLAGVVYILDQQALYHYKGGQLVKYQLDVDVPNPLKIGQITIDGTTNTITSNSILKFGSQGVDYISIENDIVSILKSLVSDGIKSPDYTHKASGYAIYRGDNNLACLEIDNILIRNKLEYLNITDITYLDLVKLVRDKHLIKGKKYRITDFQNEWEVDEKYIDNLNNRYKYYWPVILTADSTESFEEYGYFCDNEKWIIKYDIDFCYFVSAHINQGLLVKNYTTGRITYLRDEFGNEANYDFKHRLFKHTSTYNDPRAWFFTYSYTNPNFSLEDLEYYHIHLKADYSLTGKIVNNIIYIKEPSFKEETITVGSLSFTENKLVLYDEYIIFPRCSDLMYPYNNTILSSTGKYEITSDFHDNNIKGLIQNVKVTSLFNFDFEFTGNTADIIYIKHEYVAPTISIDPETGETIETYNLPQSSSKETRFKTAKVYQNNTFNDITDSIFDENLIGNTFKNVVSSKFTGKLTNNVFEKDLQRVYFNCLRVENNSFLDEIDTNYNPNLYVIDGVLIKDNVFNKITRTQFQSSALLTNNTFSDITFTSATYTKFNGLISDSTFGDITGVEFLSGSKIQKNQFSTISTNNVTTLFKGEIKECEFGPIIDTVFDTGSNLYRVITYDEIMDIWPTINTCKFENKVENVNYNLGVTYVKFKGHVKRSNFHGTITGVSSSNPCELNTINFSEFNGDIYKFNMNQSTISNSTFNVISDVKLLQTSSIQNSSFSLDFSKIEYLGDISKSDFYGKIYDGILKCNITMCTFEEDILTPNIVGANSKIEYCNFSRTVSGLKADERVDLISNYFYLSVEDLTVEGTISYCKFNGIISGANISGTITNCGFMGLSNGIVVKGPLSNTDIHDDITPSSAEWVERINTGGTNDEYIRISDLSGAFTEFEISSDAVPKLAGTNKKDCYIRSITKDNVTRNIFIVSLGSNINADNAIQGMIVMMSGGYPIPDGWAICDGNNGTPDLRGRFIRMVGYNETTEEWEQTGKKDNSDLETNGSGTRQAYLKKVITHSHNYKTYSDTLTADYSGLTFGYNGNASMSALDMSAVTITARDRLSVVAPITKSNYVGGGEEIIRVEPAATGSTTAAKITSVGNVCYLDHGTHTLSGTVSGTITLPAITVTGDITVPINFTPEEDTPTGMVNAVNVEPLAYALIFIMKL